MKKSKGTIDESASSNTEWASAIKNILSMDKPKSKNSVVLSRAEKLDPKMEKDDDEDDSPNKTSAQSLIKKEWLARGRFKPNPSEEGERERKLRRVAVAGVVQLFNAVGKHQKTDKSIGSTDIAASSVTKTSSFKPLNKKSFFNMLLGKDGGLKNDDESVKVEVKEEELKEENNEEEGDKEDKWDVLRSDFMMSTKLKDWDKQVENDSS